MKGRISVEIPTTGALGDRLASSDVMIHPP
jgi:hypothetical protein